MIRSQLAEFIRRMQANSVAIIPAAREATRSNDTNYRFRQDSDFFYLTGNESLNGVLVIDAAAKVSHLFLPKLTPTQVRYEGGNWLDEPDAAKAHGFTSILPIPLAHLEESEHNPSQSRLHAHPPHVVPLEEIATISVAPSPNVIVGRPPRARRPSARTGRAQGGPSPIGSPTA